ncbi:MAG: hypothetical protein ACFFBP_05185, partial [Promethearchaeota archaeon]
YDYYYEYWVPKAIPLLINEFADPESALSTMMPAFIGMDTKDIAYMYFLEQWADCEMFEDGVDFHTVVEEIPEGTFGLEINRPDASGITLNASYALWDKNNEHSLLNLTGILEWYEANKSSSSSEYAMLLDEFDEHDLNETHMDMLLNWLWAPGGFSDQLLPILIESELGYGVPIDELAVQILYEQWSNVTALGLDLYPLGMDFGDLIDGIDPDTTGFEAGLPDPLGLTVEECEALWDETNDLALTNIDGILVWLGANSSSTDQTTLLNEFTFLNPNQLDDILNWLWAPGRFADELLPKLVQAPPPYGYGVPMEKLARIILFEQWANGTVMGMELYDEGIDFNELIGGFGGPVVGLEVGIPEPSGLTLDQCEDLWNISIPLSLLDMMTGIPAWVKAKDDTSVKQDLMDYFGITLQQIDKILNWLWAPGGFSDYLVPILIESELGYGIPMADFCFHLLLEQWANGTVMGNAMYEEGFPLPLVGGERVGFEVGIPEATGMSLESALALWDPESDYSLVNPNGLAKWFAAVAQDTDAYAELISANGLDDHAMQCIINWIPNFQQNVMPYLAQHQYSLPTDSITLGNIIQIGGIGIGGLLVGIGAVSITGSVVSKRRKVTKSSSKSVNKLTDAIYRKDSSSDAVIDSKSDSPEPSDNMDEENNKNEKYL